MMTSKIQQTQAYTAFLILSYQYICTGRPKNLKNRYLLRVRNTWTQRVFDIFLINLASYQLRTNSACKGNGGFISGYFIAVSESLSACQNRCDTFNWCRGVRYYPSQCALLTPSETQDDMSGYSFHYQGHWVEPADWEESTETNYDCYERILGNICFED